MIMMDTLVIRLGPMAIKSIVLIKSSSLLGHPEATVAV